MIYSLVHSTPDGSTSLQLASHFDVGEYQVINYSFNKTSIQADMLGGFTNSEIRNSDMGWLYLFSRSNFKTHLIII